MQSLHRLEAAPGGQPDLATSLLDTYHASGTQPLPACCATRWRKTAITGSDERIAALRAARSELLSTDQPRKRFAARLSGLDNHYDPAPANVREP